MSIFDIRLDRDDVAALRKLNAGGGVSDRRDTPEVFQRLLRLGLAERKMCGAFNYAPGIVISGAGRDYLKYIPQLRRRKANAVLINLLSAAAGAAVSWGIEHFADLVKLFQTFGLG